MTQTADFHHLPSGGPIFKTIGVLLAGMLILTVAGCGGGSSQSDDSPPGDEPQGIELVHPNLRKPLDLLVFKGQYVAAEMETGRLAIFDDLSFAKFHHFDPADIGQYFNEPHFLSLSPWGTLLVSNGTGMSIVEIADLDGTGWREFSGVEIPFNSPHGICIDDKGWIYVGDSLNSRIVRFRDMDGSGWEIFGDIDRRVAYSRQLAWHDGALWVSNSYEQRPGLNPGKGANVLRITDFSSGKSEIVWQDKRDNVNITGILPLDDQLFVSVWGEFQLIIRLDLNTQKRTDVKGSNNALGIPYGLFYDPVSSAVIAAYFGNYGDNKGGLFKIGPN